MPCVSAQRRYMRPEHLGPVGRVGAARAGADRHDRAVRVVGPVEVGGHLELVERLDGARQRRVGLGFGALLAAQHVEDLGRVVERRLDRIDRVQVGGQVGDLLHHPARPLGVAPEVVGARARLQFGYGAALVGVVKAAP